MAHAAVAVDLHQPLDVQVDLATEIALHDMLAVDDLAQTGNLVFAQVARASIGWDGGPRQDLVCRRGTNPVDVRQRDPDLFISGDIYAGNTCHVFSDSLALLLFVLGV